MSIMHSEWTGRLNHWIRTLKDDLYLPLGEIKWSMFRTMDELSLEEAKKGSYEPVNPGYVWGKKYEYGWLRGVVTIPEEADGKRIVVDLNPGGESTVFVNDKAFGNYRADWVREKHHFMVDNFLTREAKAGETFEIMVEVYAGHFFPQAPTGGCATGPVLPGSYKDPKTDGARQTLGSCTFGIWNEDAYQLYMDVDTLKELLKVIDEDSLRASKIAEALEKFTLDVDFEQPLEGRIRDYKKARENLRPVMEAKNGSTMPMFYAIGNSHLDLAWLWPMQETYRKTARTFAAQLRLLEEYPDYVYIQSQPASYEMCRQYYPELFERIKAAVKEGRWIADGGMWVEPDTNMSSGEALIRQLLYGKKYYKEVLGVESHTLWLPDTFGYSCALPQILKGCDVQYLVTQKIFWSYNEGDKFPYHYFKWQGIDGSAVTAFLPTSYTYYTTPTEANKVWKNRTQKRDLEAFLFPYGYGDGGGGPTRDYVEYVERQKDLEGSVKMKHASPQQFFEEMDAQGGPANTYRGELYFSAHRGTYTSQAAVKRNNRKAELALREMEIWASLAMEKGVSEYPTEAAERLWKELLLHQFHDILPGSGIKEIYVEARERVGAVIEEAGSWKDLLVKTLTDDENGCSVFNSLSFERTALVKLPDGSRQLVKLPPMGAKPVKDAAIEAPSVVLSETADGFVLENGLVTCVVSHRGEIVSFKIEGSEREFAAGAMNRFRFFKDVPRLFDAWDIDSNYVDQEVEGLRNISVTIGEVSPLSASLLVKGEIGESLIEQEIVLEAASKRVEFRTKVDWRELHRLLKVAFPVNVYTDNVINEIQFGYVERPVHRSKLYDKDRFEVCNHRYSALADGSHGAAILNESKYGMSANGNSMELTLLRAAASPEMRADNGVHEFTYAFTAFEGSFAESDVVKQGLELNVPPVVAEGNVEAFSAFALSADNIILDSVKAAEDGSGDLILRLYESKRCDTFATLCTALSVKEACAANMLEEKGEALSLETLEKGAALKLHFGPFEIKTLRLSF